MTYAISDANYLRDLNGELTDNAAWNEFKKAQISIEKPSFLKSKDIQIAIDNLKDYVLLAIPLGITNGLIPSLTHSYINGKMTGLMGVLACVVGGYFAGNNLFSFLDRWHSDNTRLSSFFGKDNIRPIRVGSQFAVFTVLNFLAHALAQYCINFSDHVSMAIQASRILLFTYSLFSQRSSTFQYKDNFFGKFRFTNPILRRNKYDRSFTVGDLVDANL